VASELAIASLVVYLPFLQRVVGTAALPWQSWLWIVPLAPLLLVADEARKALRRRSPEVT
jgi:Ca2+-transporting ATPase